MPPRIQCDASRRLAAAATTTTGRICTPHAPPRCTARVLWLRHSAPATLTTPRHYATASPVTSVLKLPDDYIPPTQPPSARRPEFRKSQLLRSYTSLLRSCPIVLMFQHNNLTAAEWAAIRRELRAALAAVPLPAAAADGTPPINIAPYILLQIVHTRMFNQALKVLEFFDPASVETSDKTSAKKAYTHDLSMEAYKAVKAAEAATFPEDSMYAQLAPLLIGSVALLTFPAVSPQHLAAALSILSPSPPAFPAPTRKKNPGYHDITTQSGLNKILLVGGRIEGKIFDLDGVKWVGGIENGMEGLRAQLVHMLQSAGLGLTTTLEGASKSLWLTLESRRTQLEDAGKEGEKKE